MNRWEELTRRTLEEIERCEPIYRPTTFWDTGIRTILDDLRVRPIETFKSWPSAQTWFYPAYGNGFTTATIDAIFEVARRANPDVRRPWFRTALGGGLQARRDFDAARLAWDQRRWPFDLDAVGESEVGEPPQAFRLSPPSAVMWTRPYLNYLLCLAGLSRHVDAPPKHFVELGGGYGVLGEIVLSRDAEAVYVNLDLPPLLTVSSSYLDMLFGDRVATYEGLPEAGPLDLAGSACLPNWRIGDVRGPFDVFVNSLSFQEMEPEVVERYASDVAALDVEWVVSLNSRDGKAVQDETNPIGVRTPVTSAGIIGRFEARGYRCIETYGDPLVHHHAELAILRRVGAGAGTATGGAPAAARAPVDLRRKLVDVSDGDGPGAGGRVAGGGKVRGRKASGRTSNGRTALGPKRGATGRRGLRGRIIRALRAVRRRLR